MVMPFPSLLDSWKVFLISFAFSFFVSRIDRIFSESDLLVSFSISFGSSFNSVKKSKIVCDSVILFIVSSALSFSTVFRIALYERSFEILSRSSFFSVCFTLLSDR